MARRYVIAGSVVVIAVLAGVMVGPAGPVWWRVPLELLDRLPLITIGSGVSDAEWNILWEIRMPRVVLGGLVGAMLSAAGASYQGVFRNPLVDPYLLGAAAGAGLGATLVLTVGRGVTRSWPVDPVPTVAFVVALLTVLVTYTVGAAFGGSTRTGITLVLAGVAVTSMVTAVQTFLLQRNVDVVREVYTWILGRLGTARWGDVRLVIVIAATLGTAAVVAVSGLIGFVGIVVPHFVRLTTGSSYRTVIPLSVAFGAAFLILADIPGRVLTDPAETPIGVVTALLGAPFFLYVLRTRQVAQ